MGRIGGLGPPSVSSRLRLGARQPSLFTLALAAEKLLNSLPCVSFKTLRVPIGVVGFSANC
jgi:hypothetical protein